MERTLTERTASIVVLVTVVIAALIVDIAGTAASTSRFLGVLGLISLFGLLRHGIRIAQTLQRSLLEMSSAERAQLQVSVDSTGFPIRGRGIWFPAVTAEHEATFLRDHDDGI